MCLYRKHEMALSSSEIRRPLKGPRREASCGRVSSISYVRVDIFRDSQSNARDTQLGPVSWNGLTILTLPQVSQNAGMRQVHFLHYHYRFSLYT